MNELLQISYDRECCIVTEDKNVNPPKKNFLFRLIPKGREEPENFYMPEDVFKFMTEILQMLKESYTSNTIPDVEFRVSTRKQSCKHTLLSTALPRTECLVGLHKWL